MSKIQPAFLLFALLLHCSQAGGQETIVEVKQPAPYFILPTWDGNTLRSTSLKGKVVVLDFFQTWCPDCQKSGLELEKLYQKYKDRGLVVVGISHDREKSAVVAPYLKKYNLTYPVLLGDISVALNYIPGMTPQAPKFNIPYFVLIDREGNIAGRFQQGHEKEATDINLLEERIKKLL
jgi:peroxiredoxin